MDTVSKSEVSGLTVRIVIDPDPQSPREWTHGAELDYRHRGYDFPRDSGLTDSDIEALGSWQAVADNVTATHGALLVVPVYMLDHSGVAFRTRDFGDVDPGHWDSGVIGLAYVTPQNWKDTQGTEWTDSDEDKATARKLIDGDVEAYGRYVNGEVYGYVIEDEDGEVIESVWGIDDFDYAESEGAEAAKGIALSRHWPKGATFGELTSEQKRWAAKQAAKKLQAEMEANADVITRLMEAG